MAICKHCHDNVILIFNFAAFERKGNSKYLNKQFAFLEGHAYMTIY